ncbi:MAG: hypothetical protein QF475_03670 [Candidatus Undinarchaeales archaeon]|jgi:hypothetical protein|nr:hypothetical protein [Candidatus Undinarchaeales archaeon]
MEFNKKNIAIFGIVLVLAIVLAGFFFSPSGLVAGNQPDFVCVSIDNPSEFCEGSDSYWAQPENTFQSFQICETAHDELERNCKHYYCDCRALSE